MKENIFTRNLKSKAIALGICGGLYLVLMLISATLLKSVYLFEWMSRNAYCYTWVLPLAVIMFDKTHLAYFVTFGNLIGTVIGELLGGVIRSIRMSGITPGMDGGEVYYRSLHHGVLIWIAVMLASVIAGIIAEFVRGKHPKQAAA